MSGHESFYAFLVMMIIKLQTMARFELVMQFQPYLRTAGGDFRVQR